jgi:multicomponent Na+:H+ antiporter subunit B
MKSTILNLALPLLVPLCLILSLIVLWRGHNEPGGGFIGGLLGAAAIILLVLAYGVDYAIRKMRIAPVNLMAVGLLVAGGSGLLSVMSGKTFLTGLWLPTFNLPLLGSIHLGTPLIFDIGVYLTVFGFVSSVVFSLAEASLGRSND